VGQGLRQLGLAGADVLSSPKLRTRQTAHFLLGQDAASQDWLETCDKQFADEALARKRSGHNLVLVTHNGCIDHFARQQRVAGVSAKRLCQCAVRVGEWRGQGQDSRAHERAGLAAGVGVLREVTHCQAQAAGSRHPPGAALMLVGAGLPAKAPAAKLARSAQAHHETAMPLPLIYHDDYSPEFPRTTASRWTSSACCATTWSTAG
jgi:phosphohistidine phosphatase SixA